MEWAEAFVIFLATLLACLLGKVTYNFLRKMCQKRQEAAIVLTQPARQS